MTDQPRLTDAARAAIEAAGEPASAPANIPATGAEIVEILQSLRADVARVQYAESR